MKLLKFEKIKFIFILIVLFFIYLYLLSSSYTYAISNDLANSVLRLHILANSDSPEDQELKYKVRDNVINYMNSISTDINSKDEALRLVQDRKDEFIAIAEQTIHDNGFNYNINIDFGNFYFPTKTYGDISFPAGNYDAIRIEIGQAEGKNWWCVMFPPLCFVDVSSGIVPDDSKEQIKSTISNEEFTLISDGNSNDSTNNFIKFKFKLIEIFNNPNILTAKNSN